NSDKRIASGFDPDILLAPEHGDAEADPPGDKRGRHQRCRAEKHGSETIYAQKTDHGSPYGFVTLNRMSPCVMCPSAASTSQCSLEVPSAKPSASAARTSGADCGFTFSSRVAPSGMSRKSRERAASIRTLNRSLSGTFGPLTTEFGAGLSSSTMACANATSAA